MGSRLKSPSCRLIIDMNSISSFRLRVRTISPETRTISIGPDICFIWTLRSTSRPTRSKTIRECLRQSSSRW